MDEGNNKAKVLKFPKVLTVNELIQVLLEISEDTGCGDWPIWIANDEEGNGYRPYLYDPSWNQIGRLPQKYQDGIPEKNIVIG